MTDQSKPSQPKTEVPIADDGIAELTVELDEQSSSTSERKNDTSPTPSEQPSSEASPVQKLESDRPEDAENMILLKALIRKLYPEYAEFLTEADLSQEAALILGHDINQTDVKNSTQLQTPTQTDLGEPKNSEGKIGVQEETANFLSVLIPKQWVNAPVVIKHLNDGWEASPYPDPFEENIRKPGWVDDKIEELAELQRLKQQVAATLETIMMISKHIETSAIAMQEGFSGKDEPSDILLLVRSLALKIQYEVRRHLKVNLELTVEDDFF